VVPPVGGRFLPNRGASAALTIIEGLTRTSSSFRMAPRILAPHNSGDRAFAAGLTRGALHRMVASRSNGSL
jgi:hypothetical protein